MPEVKNVSRLLIVGDLFPTADNVSFFTKGDISSLFGEKLLQLFAESEFSVCNLEGALTDHSERCLKTGPVKTAPTAAIEAYKGLGIHCCMLANNHSMDGGHQGMVDTMQVLDRENIMYIGAGLSNKDIKHFLIRQVGNIRIGFYNVCETMYNKPTECIAGSWLYDEYLVCRELDTLKQSCDFLIVIYHGGIEKFPYPSPEMRKRFHRMADCGANMILAQHTHCVGCEEYYNNAYLLYGQGDFLLNNYAPAFTDSGLVIELEIVDDRIAVKKHLVRSVNNLFVRLDPVQDLSGFAERSVRVADEAYVFKEFQKFCDNELRLYLTAFRNPSRFRMIQRRYCPNYFKKWLNSYSERNLLFTLHTLRSEQNRETAITGLENFLNNGC